MKKKFYLYGILILVLAFVAYNYYSASQAEADIAKIIQRQIDEPSADLGIQFTSVDIAPFAGNITFRDVHVVQSQTIQRAKELTLDLSYYDFLLFNIGGIKYGLKHLPDAKIVVKRAAYINRRTRAKISARKLMVDYTGPLWNALQSAFTPHKAHDVHTITAIGRYLVYQKPHSLLGTLTVDSVRIEHTFAAEGALEQEPLNYIALKDITWNMPQQLQRRYAFFIRGMGLKPDSIAINTFSFSYLVQPAQIALTDGTLEAVLLDAAFYGSIDKKPVPAFSPLHVTITQLNPRLQNVLKGLKQLFDLPIPLGANVMTFRITGPIEHPEVAFMKQPD